MTAMSHGVVAERPIRWKRRPDLVIRPFRSGPQNVWRIKDPVALAHFELTEQEYLILSLLDGATSLQELRCQFGQRFAPETVSIAQLQGFLGELSSAGLVVDESWHSGDALSTELESRRQREQWLKWINIFSWRFRGVDPTPFLDALISRLQTIPRIFRQAGLLLFPLAALLVLMLNPQGVRERLPAMDEWFAPEFLLWLWCGITLSRAIHEVAHAVTCRWNGGECREMGILLLMFTPCLYCDVSDAWLMPERWRRLLISAAGMLAELQIAAFCFLLWWWTQPGALNSLALALAAVCSVNTLLLNGNPLLRFDGYYLLSDAVDEPNLGRKGDEFLWSTLRSVCLGLPTHAGSAGVVRHPRLVALYGLLAGVYRPLVMGGAAWGLCLVLAHNRQPALGVAVASLLWAALAFEPLRQLWVTVGNPVGRARISRRRVAGWGAGFLLVLATGLWVPFPRRVAAEALVDAPTASRIYVTVEGRLLDAVAEGADVVAGQKLATLHNPALEREIEQLETDVRRMEIRLREFEARRSEDPSVGPQIPALTESLSALRERLADRRRDLDRLLITSPVAGTWLPPPATPVSPAGAESLATWNGRPLDPSNRECWLNRGTLLGLVGRPSELEVRLRIEPGEIDLVRPGQSVRLRLGQAPGRVFRGTIVEVGVQTNEGESPAADEFREAPDRSWVGPRLRRQFRAQVRLEPQPLPLLLRDVGEARIAVAWSPLLPRVWRWLGQTFRLPAA